MRNVSENDVEDIQTHILSITFFFKIVPLWDDVEKYCRAGHATDDIIIQRMCIACWIPKATSTHSEYVILIVFPWQQWLHKQALNLHYTCMACLVWYCIKCIRNKLGCERPILLTYLITPWSRVLLEKLTSSQLVKKFPAFYGTLRFITTFTRAHHLSLSWACLIQSMPPHPTTWRSIIILSHLRLGHPSGPFPSGFLT